MSVPTLPPFFEERLPFVEDTTRKLVKESSKWLKKLPTFLTIPDFSVPNTWKGASEIVQKFVYSLSSPISIIGDLPSPNGNFCPVVSWQEAPEEELKRYKLWENVGEILYIPLYEGQRINSNFNIEVWSTNNNPIIGLGGKMYLSLMILPTTLCEEGEVDIGVSATTCTDIIYDLNGWNPSIGEFYSIVIVGNCQEAILNNL